jgi:hypothetical protein
MLLGSVSARESYFDLPLPEKATNFALELTFADDFRKVLDNSPDLDRREPSVSLAFEEVRIEWAAEEWPPKDVEVPGLAYYAFENVSEFRISSCPALSRLPSDIGMWYGLKSLVLISNSLTSLPVEIGALKTLQVIYLNGNFLKTIPVEVGELAELKELCLDANLIEVLPQLCSPHLELLTAPANRLKALPEIRGRLLRLELHGNDIESLPLSVSEAQWSKIMALKLMGNRLRQLPEAIGDMPELRAVLVSGNQLEALPNGIAKLPSLEWLFAYNNCLKELPPGTLLGSAKIGRVMLEGNPFSYQGMAMLFEESRRSWLTTWGTLSLDVEQVRGFFMAEAAAKKDSPEVGERRWRSLPWCVSVGSMLGHDVSDRFFMKLMKASQMKRWSDYAVGELGGPRGADEDPSSLLVVAFSASQGEPEWLGALRRVAKRGSVQRLPGVAGPLSDMLGAEVSSAGEAAETMIAKLWAGCGTVKEEKDAYADQAAGEGATVSFGDFDVLSVIDHRMRWYDDPCGGFARSLQSIVAKYRQTLFLGASMGGFGAILHGGRLADAVLAFSPQGRLDQATLRPPAADSEALKSRHTELCDSIRAAAVRGAAVEVHCAADEHCWHALSMPLERLSLTVHPVLPRKPFARVLDRAGVLEPILSDAMCRLFATCSDERQSMPEPKVADKLLPELSDPGETTLLVARWSCGGHVSRHWATRQQILRLFFAKGAPYMPRPGDWFCPRCYTRNMNSQFFCGGCPLREKGPKVSDSDVRLIPGLHQFPRKGDWGCGNCLTACPKYQSACPACGTAQADHEGTVVVA